MYVEESLHYIISFNTRKKSLLVGFCSIIKPPTKFSKNLTDQNHGGLNNNSFPTNYSCSQVVNHTKEIDLYLFWTVVNHHDLYSLNLQKVFFEWLG